MKLDNLVGQKIAILGFGLEGQSVTRYLLSNDITDITVFDEHEQDASKKQDMESSGVKLIIGEFESANLKDFDFVFRSPGVQLSRVKDIIGDDNKIISATNLFFGQCKAKIIGVTGTKGKSTTSQIIKKILTIKNKTVFLGGNIGVVPLEYLDKMDEDSHIILELSSFQLEDLKYSPQTAIILPITSDHLNYHGTAYEYTMAKSSICRFQQANDTVIFYSDGGSQEIARLSSGKHFPFSEGAIDQGCFVSENDISCSGLNGESDYKNALDYSIKYKIPIIDIIAALSFAYSMGFDLDLEELFDSFKKMPFRIEYIKDVDDVAFYNDSASTNPISTIAAAKTFNQPYFLIAGGSTKNLQYDRMGSFLANDENLAGVFLVGNTSEDIRASLLSAGYTGKIEISPSLQEAVMNIKNSLGLVRSVLFSPASASFDHYKNYIDRGEHFTNLINQL